MSFFEEMGFSGFEIDSLLCGIVNLSKLLDKASYRIVITLAFFQTDDSPL